MLVMSETKTALKIMREEMSPRVTQETLARRSGLLLNTYQKAENGKSIRFKTASKILKGFNEIRAEQGLPEVDIWALGLNIN